MPNILKRFNKEVIGSKKRIYDFIPKITASGDFRRVRDIDVIISSWNNLLLTPTRSYIEDPDYGSDLHKMIFEPADEKTVDKIKYEIETKCITYDNRAVIDSIKVFFIPNRKGFSVDILVSYQGEKGILTLKFDDKVK